MGPLAWLVAHGGIPGAIVEASLAVGVAALFVAVWLRERGSDETREEKERRERDRRRKGSDTESR
jgi:hypothetical protein